MSRERHRIFWVVTKCDPYTLLAPSIEIAQFAAALICPLYRVRDNETGEESPTPMNSAVKAWRDSRGMDREFYYRSIRKIIDALRSVVIGTPEQRREIEGGGRAVPLCGAAEPPGRLGRVFLEPMRAVKMKGADRVLGLGVAGDRGAAEEVERCLRISRHAAAELVGIGEREQRLRLVGSRGPWGTG